MIRILFINTCHTLQGDVNGYLAAFMNLDPQRTELFAITNPRGKVFETLKSCERVHIIPMELGGESGNGERETNFGKRLAAFVSIQNIIRVIRECSIDIIYVTDRTRAAYFAAVASHLSGCPLVISAASPLYSKSKFINKLVLRSAARIHTCSEQLRRVVLTTIKDPERVTAIHYGIDLKRYDPACSGKEVRQELGIPDDAQVVLLAGRMTPFKGHEELLTAASAILQRYPNTYFIMVGPDTNQGMGIHGPKATSYKAVLSEIIQRTGIENRVILRDAWPWSDFPRLIAAADIGAMPSWGEPFGLVALEAMAMAKPVIASRVGGVPEFVEDGKSGVLVPPRDAEALTQGLLSLLENPERARQMGIHGRERVEQNHTVEQYANKVTSVLQEALDCKHRLPPILGRAKRMALSRKPE